MLSRRPGRTDDSFARRPVSNAQGVASASVFIARAIFLLVVLVGVRGCYSEGPAPGNNRSSGSLSDTPRTKRDAGTGSAETDAWAPPTEPELADAKNTTPADDATSGACPPARTLELTTARSAVLTGSTQPSLLFTRDLFESFKGACGSCHVEDDQGGFKVNPTTFKQDMNRNPPNDKNGVLGRIRSNDPTMVMPPGSAPASSRDPTKDPYLLLAAQLEVWFDEGSPPDFYSPPMSTSTSGPAYVMSKAVGEALTNLGNCIPSKSLAFLRADAADTLDTKFAAMTSLPLTLQETDLTTFDSAVLAQTGVFSYSPTYPLWSDNAHKMRHVRVPHGKSIVFSKDTQGFTIPDNTRFYKTFTKKVVERDGTVHYRKVETRLIVARAPSGVDANGDDVQGALFGTYVWNDDETEATLLQDPLNSGKPFADKIRTLIADEAAYDRITQHTMDGGAAGGDLQTLALQRAGATRTYAIPSSDRCMQCHMGSPSRSFVLGFTPLQASRRPLGVGGVLEEPGPDELTQLERLISYGVISGVTDPSDIALLEKSEGSRLPRNDYELLAQGYMVGNCAHCHNPRGFASISNKETLQQTLSFLPGTGPIDGIFQMPLDKVSPRITRDLGGTVHIPYITPSLYDYPGVADLNRTAAHPLSAPEIGNSSESFTPPYFVFAPWRSLIYRNVDTPFAYGADLALFPHMPMNVPGFDCRLPRIMADWMVSIPAVRVNPGTPEQVTQADTEDPGTFLHDNEGTDTAEQPYKEVSPGDPGYAAAKAQANQRLAFYHNPPSPNYSRYHYCPDTTDIVDPTVTGADVHHLTPSDVQIYTDSSGTQYRVPADYTLTGQFDHTEDGTHVPSTVLSTAPTWPAEGIPDRPHWVRTDTSDPPGPWLPRQAEWNDVLVKHVYSVFGDKDADSLADIKTVVEMLNPSAGPTTSGAHLTQALGTFANAPFAYGLWKNSSACASKLASHGFKTLGSYTGASRMRWMDIPQPTPGKTLPAPTDFTVTPDQNAGAYVYSELPGAAIYNMVCVNCHGPQADSHGRQADTLQIMTGGDARVANFRDGLFGPVSAPGSNLERVFGVTGTDGGVPSGLTPYDWAARYMAFMALGGTTKLIPQPILNVVSNTPIFGVPRAIPQVGSANMLGTVQYLCYSLLFPGSAPSSLGILKVDPGFGSTDQWDSHNVPWEATFGSYDGARKSLTQNGPLALWFGDAELFARMCSIDNPPPVRVLSVDGSGAIDLSFLDGRTYPKDQKVGTDQMTVETGVSPTNLLPWCLTGDPNKLSALTRPVGPDDKVDLPLCPSLVNDPTNLLDLPDLRSWSFRGAINGGFSVFEYLKATKIDQTVQVLPAYDQCSALQ